MNTATTTLMHRACWLLPALLAYPAVAQPLPALEGARKLEEAVFFTPPGFDKPGEAKWQGDYNATPLEFQSRERSGRVEITVRDAASGRPTPCRINVVGRDGNFYQPPANRLTRFSLTAASHTIPGAWGNRLGTGPYRYIGRFFYSLGRDIVRAPAGQVRVEVWKGQEFRPVVVTVELAPGAVHPLEIALTRAAPMNVAGYYSGDTHLHFPRESDEEDAFMFDLMEAEDLRYGVSLTWHLPSIYSGFNDTMMTLQRALGEKSIRTRGDQHIVSGQEYRNTAYGHLNLLLRDDVGMPGQRYHEDQWPVPGILGRDTIARGGFAFMAHAGYGKNIYADVALGNVSSVELLQFARYRDLGLEGWYAILNSGFRFSAHGASDYAPCRTMSDNRTYVHSKKPPTTREWLAAAAAGRSFFSSGPLLLLEVDGEKPGAQIKKTGPGPHRISVRVRARCEIAPITDLDVIVNGQVVKTLQITPEGSKGRWIELEHPIDLAESSWIAARAHSLSQGGFPDAEAHTNPVFVYLDDRAPFSLAAIDLWLAKITGQMDEQAKRNFPELARELAYLQNARDVLFKIRAHGGLTAEADPVKYAPGPVRADAAISPGKRLRTAHGISERDVAVANAEVPDADHDRSRSFNRGDRSKLMAAAPPLVALQLQRSREQYGTLETWKKRSVQIREEFLKAVQLWPAPPKAPLNPIIHSHRDYDGYSVENIAIESMPGFYCTGNLYRPLNATKPGAGVLCPHGHYQPLGRFREEHQIRCAHLARMGATVLSYSMVGWNDSRQTSHGDPLALALQLLNAIAGIDYLSSLPGVDPNRIGMTGASGGGSQTAYAALVDDRVRASCPVGIIYQWMAPLGCICETGLPITQAADTNGIELAAAIAPRAQLFVSIGGDGTRDFPQTGFPFVRSVYELYGRGQAVHDAHFADEQHDYGPSKRKAMYAFFAQHLGLAPLPEDSATITIERVRQMEVFNDSQPLPANALRGAEEIARVFRAGPRPAPPANAPR